MAARSTSRFKQKPAVPFGDFMLPIIGVIAIGIVFVGVRILWNSSSAGPVHIAQPRPALSQSAPQDKQPPDAAPQLPEKETRRESVGDVQIARPIQKKENTAANRRAENKAPAESAGAQKKSPPPAQKPPKVTKVFPKKQTPPSPEPRGGSLHTCLFIVQCGSYGELSTAKRISRFLQKKGYSSSVRKVDVKGKRYYRVIVAGGQTRSAAEKISQNISRLGYPVLVRAND